MDETKMSPFFLNFNIGDILPKKEIKNKNFEN